MLQMTAKNNKYKQMKERLSNHITQLFSLLLKHENIDGYSEMAEKMETTS